MSLIDMPRISLAPVMLKSDIMQNNNEDMRYPRTLESGFYQRMISQLSNIFARLATTIDLHDPLVIDEASVLDSNLFNKTRNQWNSENILKWISGKAPHTNNTKILAICDFDAYSNGLNFVFGEAQMAGRVGAIYLPRLRQEFYGHASDLNLFQQRIVKEIVHELGHLFRLPHCEKRDCVMHFSNSLKDTDHKDYNFCDRCVLVLQQS